MPTFIFAGRIHAVTPRADPTGLRAAVNKRLLYDPLVVTLIAATLVAYPVPHAEARHPRKYRCHLRGQPPECDASDRSRSSSIMVSVRLATTSNCTCVSLSVIVPCSILVASLFNRSRVSATNAGRVYMGHVLVTSSMPQPPEKVCAWIVCRGYSPACAPSSCPPPSACRQSAAHVWAPVIPPPVGPGPHRGSA